MTTQVAAVLRGGGISRRAGHEPDPEVLKHPAILDSGESVEHIFSCPSRFSAQQLFATSRSKALSKVCCAGPVTIVHARKHPNKSSKTAKAGKQAEDLSQELRNGARA